jgi:hypothetical protein
MSRRPVLGAAFLALFATVTGGAADAVTTASANGAAVRVERAANDALLSDGQVAGLFSSVGTGLGTPARSDATFAAPGAPECAAFADALAYAGGHAVEATLGGHGDATGVPVGPGWGFAPEGEIPYDSKLARQLLREAGFPLDDELGVFVFDGTAGTAITGGTADMVVTPVFRAPSGFDAVALAGLLEDAGGIVDPKERATRYAEIQQNFADELPFTYLSTGDNAIAWDPAFVEGRVVAPADPCAVWGLKGVSAR